MPDFAWSLAALFLEESPLPSPLPEEPPIDPSLVTPGLLGLICFVLLLIAVFFLYRSLTKQIARVDPNLPDGPGDREREMDSGLAQQAELTQGAEGPTGSATPPLSGSDGAGEQPTR